MTTKKLFLVSMLFCIAVVPAFGQNQNVYDEVDRLMTRAKTAYSIEEYQDALTEYQKVSKLVPDFSDIYKAIGDVYEKIGGAENMKNAIASYEHYLLLSPNAKDKSDIRDKINSLDYLAEKQAEKDFILDDFSGIWVSNLVDKRYGVDTCYRVDLNLKPLLLFRITEMGHTGKYRVEILKESAFYKESIIKKIVNVVPDKKNSIKFTFADEERYIPSQSKWNLLRDVVKIAGSAVPGVGGDIASAVGRAVVDVGQESDIPSNTQTVYDFELQYNDGRLTGYCNLIQGLSSAKVTKDTENNFYELEFWKENDYFGKLQLLQEEQKTFEERKKARKPVSFGIRGGFGYEHYTHDYDYGSAIQMGVGIFFEIRLSDILCIQPGMNFEIYNRFEFPVNLLGKYKVGKSTWYAGLGPVINYETDPTIYFPVIKRTNFALNFKLAYSIGRFYAELGYNVGITNLFSADEYTYITGDVNLKRNGIFCLAGVKF